MKKFITRTICLILLSTSNGFAAEKSVEVQNFVQEVGDKVIEIANNSKLSEAKKREQIIAKIDTSIDSDWIGKFVLSKNYKIATDAQKDRFKKLYRDFMINTYGPKFKNYNGKKFTVIEVAEQNDFYIAKAEFLPKTSNVPISIDFRVKEVNGKLAILDFIAEGISLITTQRSEFNSAISQKGMDKFLDNLEERVKNLKSS